MVHLRGFPFVGVIGPGTADDHAAANAAMVGGLLATRGCNLVTGGLGGVMTEAARGFAEARAHLPPDKQAVIVGILPGPSAGEANPFIDIVIPTGIGEARNFVLVNTAHALIAVGRGDGTLVEIGYALKAGKPVISLGSWEVDRRVISVATPEEAVASIGYALVRPEGPAGGQPV